MEGGSRQAIIAALVANGGIAIPDPPAPRAARPSAPVVRLEPGIPRE